jgi:hypothetical protein
MGFRVVREKRKGWERFKLGGYDRFLMERDALNERTWYGRRHIERLCFSGRWADKFRWRQP